MAELKDVLKARAIAEGLGYLIGIRPTLDIRRDYIRIYYPADRLRTVQKKFGEIVERPPGKIRVELAPVMTPYYLKKFTPALAGLLAGGFILGKSF